MTYYYSIDCNEIFHNGIGFRVSNFYRNISRFILIQLYYCITSVKGLSDHATFRYVVIVVVFHFFGYWFEALAGTLVILTLLLVRKKPCLIFSMLNGRVWVPFQVCPNEDHPPISFRTHHRPVRCLYGFRLESRFGVIW